MQKSQIMQKQCTSVVCRAVVVHTYISHTTHCVFSCNTTSQQISNKMLIYMNVLCTLFTLGTFSSVLAQWGLDDLGTHIQNRVQDSLKPLENLGAIISDNVNRQLAGLGNLDQRIHEEVHKGLEPVRIVESIMKVRHGTEGTTIATFSPGGRQLVIQNEEYYSCDGVINANNGQCRGVLNKLRVQRKQDFCFITSKSVINDWYCIAPNSNFEIISYTNGRIICKTADNTPKLLIKISDFESMCRNVASSVGYKYFTHFPLKHVGNGLECSETGPQICYYSESLTNGGYFQTATYA